MPPTTHSRPRPRKQPPQPKHKTAEWRRFRGLNLTDGRTAIGDDEFAWLENAITVGDGDIRIVNNRGSAVATLSQGIVSLWGFVLSGSPVVIAICGDGSIQQVAIPGGTVTQVAPAASVTADARCAIWRGSPILILDPVRGYSSWDGSTWTVIDATRLGTALAVFQGRVWIANERTITFTAPLTFNDFLTANGSGSTIITDEAFPGNIVNLVSALEQLWIVGEGAIEAISNVVATGSAPVVTTFSITNIVTNLGSSAAASVIGYFRALAFMAQFGAYALSGVTPQKISEKIDGLFPYLTLTDVPAAVAIVQRLPFLLFLATYTGANAQAGAGPIPLVLGFAQGKWALFHQGALRWITTVLVGGVSQAWGTDGTTVYQLFGAADTTATKYKVQTKLFALGLATTMKAAMKVGLEYSAVNAVVPALQIDSESISRSMAVATGGAIVWQNASGGIIQFQNALGQDINFTTQARVLSRKDAPAFGRYLGFTVTGDDPPYTLQGFQMEYIETRRWDAGGP